MENYVFVAATALILSGCLIKKRRQKRKLWIKKLYQNRNEYGNKLLKELSLDHSVPNFTRTTVSDFEYLCSLAAVKTRKCDTNYREAITVSERMLITLRYLATGDSYTSLQYLFRVSKQSISSIVTETCDAIIEVLSDCIKTPSTEEEWLTVSNEFQMKWNFPHVIGAMDGKHVILQRPVNSSTDYDNYKNFASIVLFALVDANYKFLFVNVGSKGRISDSGVFKNTILYKKLEKCELNIPDAQILQIPYVVKIPYFILDDKAFMLNKYTMKPFEGNPEAGTKERVFNYRLSRARRVVENAFGILSSVYRVLRKPILLEPEKATKVVLATVYLYNYLRRNNYTLPPEYYDREVDGSFIPGEWRNNNPTITLLPLTAIPRRGTASAKDIRLHLATYFVTNGIIPWQHQY